MSDVLVELFVGTRAYNGRAGMLVGRIVDSPQAKQAMPAPAAGPSSASTVFTGHRLRARGVA